MNLRRAMRWALCGAGGVLLTSPAFAQQTSTPVVSDQVWLRDSRLTAGPGIRTDRWIISPGVSAAFGYDSNLYLRADTPEAPVADAFKLTLTPFVTFATRAPADGAKPSYAFSALASASYYRYFKGTKTTSDDVAASSDFGTLASATLTFAPGQRWSGDIHGGIIRSIQPSNLGDTSASYNRDIPSVGAGIQWAPGGGLFTWRLGYDLSYQYFEKAAFQDYNLFTHTVGSTASWRFLPRTSLFSDSRLSFLRYTSSTTPQANGEAVSTRVGLNGLVTNAFGFLVAGGWASTFFNQHGAQQDDFDSFVAQAEARFYLTAPPRKDDEPGLYPTTLAFGYLRDWSQSFIGNFYQRDRGYANLAYFFNGQVLATLGGGVSRLHFPSTVFADGTFRAAPFNNTEVDVTLFTEYRPNPHIGINVTGAYSQMLSDTKLPTTQTAAGAAQPTQDLRWKKLEATLGVRYLF